VTAGVARRERWPGDHGKSVVVTGSTSGIGRGIARAFAAEGTNVTLNGFGDQDAVEQERRSIEEEFGVTAIYSDADVTNPGEVGENAWLRGAHGVGRSHAVTPGSGEGRPHCLEIDDIRGSQNSVSESP
jgi:NAD(P)-dependent dehydrogenase (short-subunit alcohol dehydrogenase family)